MERDIKRQEEKRHKIENNGSEVTETATAGAEAAEPRQGS
jgi:hypothetical protein